MTAPGARSAPINGKAATHALTEEVGSWPGVEVGEHERGGGPVFRMGRRELGHLHAGVRGGAFADLPLPRRVRDDLIAAGRARPHHVLPDSGWLTVPIRTLAELRDAVEIFRMSHERATRSLERRAGPRGD